MEGTVLAGPAMGDPCPCTGLKGWDLAYCLAPGGEFEVSYWIGENAYIVLTRRGLVMRRHRMPEELPYLTVQEARVAPETLEARGVSLERVLCDAVRGLREAARHGSEAAARILESCRDIVAGIEAGCMAPHGPGYG